MAKIPKDSILNGITGAIGQQVVLKKRGDKTIMTAYPVMDHLKPTSRQKTRRMLFMEAVAYARSIVNNPDKKKAYEAAGLPEGKSVYGAAISEYMKRHAVRNAGFKPPKEQGTDKSGLV